MTLPSLIARDLVKAYGDRVVLAGVDLTATPGRPLAVVGENGVGKSTLLRLLAEVEAADQGTVERPDDLGYLGQDPAFASGTTVGVELTAALAPLHDAVVRLEELARELPAATDEYADLLAWAERHDVWDADRRAQVAAARLGLAEVQLDRPVASLSGGQRSRLALAALLTRRPDCLILDEPTNHLDDEAISFLEQTIAELPGCVVVASHDRTFLDTVSTSIVDLDPSLDEGRFTGGYSDYLSAKRAARSRWEEAFSLEQTELERLRVASKTTARQVAHNRAPRDKDKFIYNFKGGNVERTISRRVRDTERRIEVIERSPVPKPPAPLVFRGRLTAAGSSVRVRGLVVPERLSLARLDVAIGEKLLVTGANGSGKSTLLKVLAGKLAATGDILVNAGTVGYLPQDVVFRDASRTARQVSGLVAELGLLHPRDLGKPVRDLSLGQQRRVALGVLLARQPELLLLDEPTNHISLTLAEELEVALQRTGATVIVATHDRWLRSHWQGEVLDLVR